MSAVLLPEPETDPHKRAGIYHYDEFDREFLKERVGDFRRQVERRLAGELTEEEFRPLRLMNGLYLQLHAYMLRVAVPYGVLSSTQLRGLARVARAFGAGRNWRRSCASLVELTGPREGPC